MAKGNHSHCVTLEGKENSHNAPLTKTCYLYSFYWSGFCLIKRQGSPHSMKHGAGKKTITMGSGRKRSESCAGSPPTLEEGGDRSDDGGGDGDEKEVVEALVVVLLLTCWCYALKATEL